MSLACSRSSNISSLRRFSVFFGTDLRFISATYESLSSAGLVTISLAILRPVPPFVISSNKAASAV